MLLDGHDLDAVITVLDDARQDVLAELRIGAHLLRILTHADMALVDEQRTLVGLEGLFLPLVRLFGSPYLSGEYLRLLVLHHALDPCRDALALAAVPLHVHLEQVAMLHGLLRQFQLPVARALNALAAVLVVLLPVVEVTHQIDVGSVGGPLAEHPLASWSLMQSEILMAVGKVREFQLSVAGKLVQFPQSVVMTSAYGVLEGLQPSVVHHQSNVLRLFGGSLFGCSLLGSGLLGLFCRFLCSSHYALILKIAFLMAGSLEMQGACPSCGKKMAISPGLQVT